MSADSRLAASSKELDVRVEDSKKTFMTVRPRSVGTFLTSRSHHRLEPGRRVQDPLDGGPVEVGDRDQVAAALRA